jgi:hypothetical protein
MHIFLIVYIYFIGEGSGEVPFSELSINLVFSFGLITGLFSIFYLFRNLILNNNNHLKIHLINVLLSLLVIPQVFMISLIYFFEMN